MDANSPLASVVTPAFNSASFLPEVLSCLEHQSYPSVEHIVVDGGSTDGSLALLQQTDPARHTWFSRADRSMYEALNFGIQRSHGEVVACLNADDLYFPDSIARAMTFLDRHPDVDIAYGDQLTLFLATASFDFYLMENEYSDPWGSVLVYISQPAVFVRRRVFDGVGLFDPHLRAAGDFDFWFRAYRAGARFKRIPRLLAMVRFHGKNLSLGETWQAEHEALKQKYLPRGMPGRLAERYRRLKRKLRVNQMTLPFLSRYPRTYVRFHRRRYFGYLWSRKPSIAPILEIETPYFRFSGFRALNFHGAV
jgi:glycosyltransferase involved in cell wall biosynthesis